MRKIVMFNRISTDGFFAGPEGETHEWFIHDPGIDKATHEMMDPDTALLGRVTYQLFESFWPKIAEDPKAPQDAKKIGDELNEMTKLVASKTLKELTWQNSKLIKGNLTDEVRKLKQGKGKDIVIFGSGTVVQQLIAENLIDEYLIAITPVILGKGKSFFRDVNKLNLKLLSSKAFDTGNILLHYAQDQTEDRVTAAQYERENQLI